MEIDGYTRKIAYLYKTDIDKIKTTISRVTKINLLMLIECNYNRFISDTNDLQ